MKNISRVFVLRQLVCVNRNGESNGGFEPFSLRATFGYCPHYLPSFFYDAAGGKRIENSKFAPLTVRSFTLGTRFVYLSLLPRVDWIDNNN